MYYVYITASQRKGTLYIGVSNDLVRRIFEHKEGRVDGFARRFGCNKLVWFDNSDDVISVIRREKQLKAWKRLWKIELIEAANPEWRDLYYEIIPGASDRPRRK
jgi:putative endonuclease